MIQVWAFFGLAKLYQISEPARAPSGKTLSQRLRESLFRRVHSENEHVSGRMARSDSFLMLLIGAALMMSVLAAAYQGITDGIDLSRSLYTTLYLVAQIFCFGVIAFLAQLYAANSSYAFTGYLIAFSLSVAVFLYVCGRYGWTQVGLPPLNREVGGTLLFAQTHAGLSPLALRAQALGWVGAILPWVMVGVMGATLLRTLYDSSRGHVLPVFGLVMAGLLAAYDLFAVRSLFHFLIVLPGWAALALAWGRCGYRDLGMYAKFPDFRLKRLSA